MDCKNMWKPSVKCSSIAILKSPKVKGANGHFMSDKQGESLSTTTDHTQPLSIFERARGCEMTHYEEI